jgi:hypothetical protein
MLSHALLRVLFAKKCRRPSWFVTLFRANALTPYLRRYRGFMKIVDIEKETQGPSGLLAR